MNFTQTTPLKILIIQTAFLGDVILTTALIEKLSQQYKNLQLDFLLRKGNESVLTNHPNVNELLVWDKSKKWKNAFFIIKKIRLKQYHFVINVQRHFTTGLITALSGSDYKIGFANNPLSFFYNQKIQFQKKNIHETQRNQYLIESLTDNKPVLPKLYPSNKEEELAKKFVVQQFITISAGSVWETKKLPIIKWIDFCNAVPFEFTIYFLGSKNELEEAQEIINQTQHPKIINLCGRLNLLASAALMRYAKMNYCNDSAPTHLASAVNAPVTTVYCSTSPVFGFSPLSDNSFIIESAVKLSCKPCTNHGKKVCPLKHFNCGNYITTQQLLESFTKN